MALKVYTIDVEAVEAALFYLTKSKPQYATLVKLLELTDNGRKEFKGVMHDDCLLTFTVDGSHFYDASDFGYKSVILSKYLTSCCVVEK